MTPSTPAPASTSRWPLGPQLCRGSGRGARTSLVLSATAHNFVDGSYTSGTDSSSADQIDKLVLYGHCNVCGGVQGSLESFAPTNRDAADHNTPYAMAMAVLRGRMTPREYEGAPWDWPEVRALMSRIALVREPGGDRALDEDGVLGVRLVAQLRNGRTHEVVIHQPKGHPNEPFSDANSEAGEAP